MPHSVDIHSNLPNQIAIIDTHENIAYPKSSIEESNPIEFDITPNYQCAIDPHNLFLYIEAKIVTENGDTIPPTITRPAPPPADGGAGPGGAPIVEANPEKYIIPQNNLISALIEDIIIKINGTIISGGDNNYAHRADLETRLSYPIDCKQNMLSLGLYEEELKAFNDYTEDQIKAICDIIDVDASLDRGLSLRFRATACSNRFTLMGKIHSEICEQTKLLPEGIPLNLKIEFNKGKFYLLTNGGQNPKVKIDKAWITYKNVKLAPEIIEGQEKLLQSNNPAIFPFRKPEIRTFSIGGPTTRDISIPEVSLGEVPRNVIIGLIRNTAYNGNYKQDAFNYEHFNLESIELKIGGQSYPYNSELRCDFNNGYNGFCQGLTSLLKGTHTLYNRDKDLGINVRNYKNRNVLYGFDLSPSQTPAGESFDIIKSSTVSLNIRLREEVDHALTIVCYLSYDKIMKIDKFKNVVILNTTEEKEN